MSPAAKITGPRPLTAREVDILIMIGDGLSQVQIGKKLGISHKTVEYHKANLYAKIKVRNAIGAVRFAIRERYMKA